MKPEEFIAHRYLKSISLGDVVFEPYRNSPPDFAIAEQIGVEVRRLNQHYFGKSKPEGLESLEHAINRAFVDVLRSFDKNYQGESYFVKIEFQRPLASTISTIKKQMREALSYFLTEKHAVPCNLQVNDFVSFYIFRSEPEISRVFQPAGQFDADGGGSVFHMYFDNISYCIKEKNSKTNRFLSRYDVWWLLLVDTMLWVFSEEQILELKNQLPSLGNFQKLIIIDRGGQLLFEFTPPHSHYPQSPR